MDDDRFDEDDELDDDKTPREHLREARRDLAIACSWVLLAGAQAFLGVSVWFRHRSELVEARADLTTANVMQELEATDGDE